MHATMWIRLSSMALFLLSLAGASTVTAQEKGATYDLRGPGPMKGMVIREKSKTTMKDGKHVVKNGDQKIEGKLTFIGDADEEVEFLAVQGRDVTKARTRKIKDETKITIEVEGNKETETESDELAGEIILSEKVKDGWKNTLVDTNPNEKQKKALEIFEGPINDDDIYPADKVPVGHQWDINAVAFRKVFGTSKATDLKGKARGKLEAIRKINGEECAVIHIDFDMTCKMPDADGVVMDVQMSGKLVSHRSLKTGIDVQYRFDGRGKYSGVVATEKMKLETSFEGPMIIEGTQTIKK